jgi:hypothetical protein
VVDSRASWFGFVESFAMSDFDQFERRLSASLRSDADLHTTRFEPASIARSAIATARPRRLHYRLGTAPADRRSGMAVAYLLMALGLVLALIAGAIAAGAFRARPLEPSGWAPTGSMLAARTRHSATLLPEGKVLAAGGSNGSDPVASAELFDPAIGYWVATGAMTAARSDHTATLLPGGMVLVAGGRDDQQAESASAELFDPATGSWVATGSMGTGRADHTATLLSDGRVLVAGGFGVTSAEIYDPATGTWARTGAMTQDRAYHTATLLPDGRVLVAGGFGGGSNARAVATAEIFDPRAGTWTATGAMDQARAGHAASLLPDGHVLVVGGSSGLGSFPPTSTAEVYDPGTGAWTATGSMNVPRVYVTATLLPDGAVLVAGGFGGTTNTAPVDPVAPAELFDPASGSWAATERMTEARTYPTATLLDDGRVLVTGGNTQPVLGGALASAELFGPSITTR